jgi:plastocyanin
MKSSLAGLALVCFLLTAGAVLLQTAQPSQAAVTPVHVKIVNYAFEPSTITVVMGVNNTVIWSNNGTVDHTVTADEGAFASGALSPGQTFSFTFTSPGTYAYHCSIHPIMTGTVHVLSQATGTTSSTASTGGGSAVPEYPFQLGLTLLATVVILASYSLVRHARLSTL